MTQKALIDGGLYSSVHVSVGNGYGSTYSRRYTTIVTNVGTAITYADSASGSTFTVNVDGIYSCSMCEMYPTQGAFGISKNEINPADGALTVANRLAIAHTPTGVAVHASRLSTCSWTGPLVAGDIIRPLGDGTTPTNSNLQMFNITKVG